MKYDNCVLFALIIFTLNKFPFYASFFFPFFLSIFNIILHLTLTIHSESKISHFMLAHISYIHYYVLWVSLIFVKFFLKSFLFYLIDSNWWSFDTSQSHMFSFQWKFKKSKKRVIQFDSNKQKNTTHFSVVDVWWLKVSESNCFLFSSSISFSRLS